MIQTDPIKRAEELLKEAEEIEKEEAEYELKDPYAGYNRKDRRRYERRDRRARGREKAKLNAMKQRRGKK